MIEVYSYSNQQHIFNHKISDLIGVHTTVHLTLKR